MIVFCLADVRSGTTALARCFKEDAAFVNLGEIFYNNRDGQGHYIKRWEFLNPPSIALFDEYLSFLRGDQSHIYWLDIKFHDLNRFNPLQYTLSSPPLILQRILDGGDPTVLIGRANSLRGACSEFQAIRTGKFHVKIDKNKKKKTKELDDAGRDSALTIGAIRNALDRKKTFMAVEHHLINHNRLFRLDYEAAFEGNNATTIRSSLGRWIGVDAVTEPDLKKIAVRWPVWFDQDLALKILQGTNAYWWAL